MKRFILILVALATLGTAWAGWRGDVNGDGNVNISDVTALIDYLLSGDVSPFDSQAADVNIDGNIKALMNRPRNSK